MEAGYKNIGVNFVFEVFIEKSFIIIFKITSQDPNKPSYSKTLSYDGFPSDIQKAFDSIEEIYELFEDTKSFVVDAEFGILTLYVKKYKKKFINLNSNKN